MGDEPPHPLSFSQMPPPHWVSEFISSGSARTSFASSPEIQIALDTGKGIHKHLGNTCYVPDTLLDAVKKQNFCSHDTFKHGVKGKREDRGEWQNVKEGQVLILAGQRMC